MHIALPILTTFFLVISTFTNRAVADTNKLSSPNFTINSSVFSSGEAEAISPHFRITGSLSQPPPVAEDNNNLVSDTYIITPGFWETVFVTCSPFDSDGDGDVDGIDLAHFAVTAMVPLEALSAWFGTVCYK